MESFEFNPVNGFRDSSSYPDPANEAAAREQLMSLHDQEKVYMNSLGTAITSLQTEVQAIAGASGDPDAIAQITAGLEAVKTWFFTDTIASPTSDSTVYTNGYKKTYTNTLISDATEALIVFPNGDYLGNITWQTNADNTIELFFDTNPAGKAMRVVLIGTYQTGV